MVQTASEQLASIPPIDMVPPMAFRGEAKIGANPGNPVWSLAGEIVSVSAIIELGASPTHGATQTKRYVAPVLVPPVVVVILIAEYWFVAVS